ncbi:hypothetical protein AL485_02585 [Serratia liquefaciens]|nr:hypothetical protein AL485_02585 [Serratia liquefaciens]
MKEVLIETPEENSLITFIKKWAYRIIILIAASMAAVIAKPFGIMLADQYQESKVWKEATEEVDKKKIEMKLPKRIDVNTQVSDVFVSGRELHYVYLINDLNISEDNRKDINSFALTSFNKALCDNALITKYHGTSVYTYKFPNGTLTYKFTKTDCRNPH